MIILTYIHTKLSTFQIQYYIYSWVERLILPHSHPHSRSLHEDSALHRPTPPPGSWTATVFSLNPSLRSCSSCASPSRTSWEPLFSCPSCLKNRNHIPAPVWFDRNSHQEFFWAYSWVWQLIRGWCCFILGFSAIRRPFEELTWLIYRWLFFFSGLPGLVGAAAAGLGWFWQRCRQKGYITRLAKVIIRRGTCLQIQSNSIHYCNKKFGSDSREAVLLTKVSFLWTNCEELSPNPAPCSPNYRECGVKIAGMGGQKTQW